MKRMDKVEEHKTVKIKVLMVGPDRSVQGGISNVINNWYKARLDKRVELRYIGTMVDGSKFAKLCKALQAYVLFARYIKKYDVVHVNMATDTSYYRKLYFIYMAKLFHKKVILHQHGGDVQRFFMKSGSGKSRSKKYHNLNKADILIVLAPIWKDFFSQVVSSKKIVVLPNGISIPDYRLETKNYQNHKIVYIGRICKEKGIKELFESVSDLRDKYKDIQLYLGGRWEDKTLQRYYETHKEWIVYLGWINDKQKQTLLEECSIFVMPSYFEGQGIAVLEGMAYGCTPVASRVGGLQQTFIDGKDGLLVEPKNVKQLTSALDSLLSDSTKKKRIGHAAYKKVHESFDLNIVTEQLVSIYALLAPK